MRSLSARGGISVAINVINQNQNQQYSEKIYEINLFNVKVKTDFYKVK